MIQQFQQMPKGMQAVLAVLTGTSLLGVVAMFDRRAVLVIVIGLVLIALAVASWKWIQAWQSRRRAEALKGQLARNSAAAPSSVSDPAKRARLDDLRQNFARGLEKFSAAGKDLYALPWYVVCGEPGSGKTEAVRHCGVGFPPGLQDEMQGAGGTLNMHWWFTNQAVLLDTAGKLLFQEAPAGTTTEWTEFLSLMRKARPNCPINGLFLVIPAESLIRDRADDIVQKAGKIARQLDQIQRSLDVRFPVFVLVTKCDLINGFREFFAGMKDPSLQNQMLGWSNPDPLDSQFRPEAVEAHLTSVVERLRKRRLGLLRDPVPAESGGRRIDEVDALFTLPQSLGALAPALRRYLETIFVAGEWSAKPLFLRGIYFTSALTEGTALDAELASVLGIPVENLPEGKAWERERSFFLRDVFLQKAFREKGLVTRASNTRVLLQTRQWIVGGCIAAGLLVLVVSSLLARRALRGSVDAEAALWRVAVQPADWSGRRWRPIVTPGMDYVGRSPMARTPEEESAFGAPGSWTVIEYHERLRERVATDLSIPWIFKPIEAVALRANANRRKAQRVLFEAGVVGPILDATRQRFLDGAPWAPEDGPRLAALVRLETSALLRGVASWKEEFPAEEFMPPLMAPALARVDGASADLEALEEVYEWTYFRGGDGRGKWPGAWLAGGDTLRENAPIDRALELFETSVRAAQTSERETFRSLQSGRLLVIRYLDEETAFLTAAQAPRAESTWRTALSRAWADFGPRAGAVDELATSLRPGVPSGVVTLEGAYRAAVERVRGAAGKPTEALRAALGVQQAAADKAADLPPPAGDYTLHQDLRRRLDVLSRTVGELLEAALPASELAQFPELDAAAMAAVSDGRPAYTARHAVYAGAMERITAGAGPGSLFGRLLETAEAQKSALEKLGAARAAYDGPRRADFARATDQLLAAARAAGIDDVLAAYRRQLQPLTGAAAGFPLGSGNPMDRAAIRTAASDLRKVAQDASAALSGEIKDPLQEEFRRAAAVQQFVTALLGADDSPQTVKLVLRREGEQASMLTQLAGPAAGPRQPLARVFPSFRAAGRDFRPRGLTEDLEVIRFAVSDPVPAIEFFRAVDPTPSADAVLRLDQAWGALRLLRTGANRRADGREWDTLLRINDGGTELLLGVTLVFERPLPPLDQWPGRP